MAEYIHMSTTTIQFIIALLVLWRVAISNYYYANSNFNSRSIIFTASYIGSMRLTCYNSFLAWNSSLCSLSTLSDEELKGLLKTGPISLVILPPAQFQYVHRLHKSWPLTFDSSIDLLTLKIICMLTLVLPSLRSTTGVSTRNLPMWGYLVCS